MCRAQLEANGLTVHYTEDTSVLSAETLKDKKVLVILKDGGWPPEDGQWMKSRGRSDAAAAAASAAALLAAAFAAAL